MYTSPFSTKVSAYLLFLTDNLISGRSEAELVEDIVNDVVRKLNRMFGCEKCRGDLVGIEYRVKQCQLQRSNPSTFWRAPVSFNVLSYLHWEEFPSKCLATNFCAENLIDIILTQSKLKRLWKGKQVLQTQELPGNHRFDGIYVHSSSNRLYKTQEYSTQHRESEIIGKPLFGRNCGVNPLVYGPSVAYPPWKETTWRHYQRVSSSYCKRLRFLPKLPPSLETLRANDCDSLKTYLNNIRSIKCLQLQISCQEVKFHNGFTAKADTENDAGNELETLEEVGYSLSTSTHYADSLKLDHLVLWYTNESQEFFNKFRGEEACFEFKDAAKYSKVKKCGVCVLMMGWTVKALVIAVKEAAAMILRWEPKTNNLRDQSRADTIVGSSHLTLIGISIHLLNRNHLKSMYLS
ncbi:hypothetical protein Tsubulata_019483 [Turnera subulata]|uniref:Uncharacterized protein n=1 Tax=Turnera subulata TaxID=218843 RepID=A0A9Q0IZQ1_9ROSI|nr:hypothetical protein Tsubulata_019483 [Turnera subulata]